MRKLSSKAVMPETKKAKVVVTPTVEFTQPTITEPVIPVVDIKPVPIEPVPIVPEPPKPTKELPYFNLLKIPIGAFNTTDAVPGMSPFNQEYEGKIKIIISKGYVFHSAVALNPGLLLFIFTRAMQ